MATHIPARSCSNLCCDFPAFWLIGTKYYCLGHYQARISSLKKGVVPIHPMGTTDRIGIDPEEVERRQRPALPDDEEIDALIGFAERPVLVTWRDSQEKKRRVDQLSDTDLNNLFFWLQRNNQTKGHTLTINIVGAEVTRRKFGTFPPQYAQWLTEYRESPENDRLEVRI